MSLFLDLEPNLLGEDTRELKTRVTVCVPSIPTATLLTIKAPKNRKNQLGGLRPPKLKGSVSLGRLTRASGCDPPAPPHDSSRNHLVLDVDLRSAARELSPVFIPCLCLHLCLAPSFFLPHQSGKEPADISENEANRVPALRKPRFWVGKLVTDR